MAVEPYFSYLFPTLEAVLLFFLLKISFWKGEKHNKMMGEKCTENI